MSRTAWAGASVAALGMLLAAYPASSAVTVFGGDQAQACYQAAKYGDPTRTGLGDCTLAIESTPLSLDDLAGTYVNRGVVHMLHEQFRLAQADFEFRAPAQGQSGRGLCQSRRGPDRPAPLRRWHSRHRPRPAAEPGGAGKGLLQPRPGR